MSLDTSVTHKINYEIAQIEKEFDIINLLAKKLYSSELDSIELRAAASSMQSVYTGYEKILILLLKNNKYPIPQSHSWHSDLLVLCKDKDLISSELEAELRDLMGFRHFIHHAYSFMLDNDLLEPLLKNMNKLLDKFKSEIIEKIAY